MQKEKLTFILFGGTGDLTNRKLVPAFADLILKGKLDKDSMIIGIGRKDFDDKTYKDFIMGQIKNNIDREHIDKLDIKYYNADFTKQGSLEGLKNLVKHCEIEGCNRIYYLATSYKFFGAIAKELKKHNLTKQKKGITRIVFEKPFGEDLKSSDILEKNIHEFFKEENVYRIDHYLGKETVFNLNVLNFTNPILYSTLNKEFVESIEITIDESIGVENRLEYYNETGVIKDMIQSHLLQVLSLVLMDRPNEFVSEKIHDKKMEVLRNLEIVNSKNNTIGQYESYRKELAEKNLNDKKTETFVRIELNCKNNRWDGVPLILRTGKKLKKKFGQIKINFKQVENFDSKLEGVRNNKIVIGIYPKQDVNIYMNTRDPYSDKIRDVNFEFCRDCNFGPNTVDEYSVLLNEIMKGNKTLFTRSDEIRESWKLVDKLEKMKSKMKFVYYRDGSDPETGKKDTFLQ
ncbi:glucose-6-phosphate dehydrogenase [Candidatus Pacearchaeota archaeon]|nr:glucose-6-phosphate dehydrogenase [Candidatus Pacearchaeota archaeon]